MRMIGIGLAAGLLALAAGGANAQEMPNAAAFARLCLPNHGDAAATLAAADAEGGWSRLTDADHKVFDAAIRELAPEEIQTRAMVVDGKKLVLMTGRGHMPIAADEKLTVILCSIGGDGWSAADARAALHAKMGFEPVQTDAESDLYAFTETGPERSPFKAGDSEAARHAAEGNNLSLAMAMGQQQSMAFVYAVVVGVEK
jgi:hypothetical protein